MNDVEIGLLMLAGVVAVIGLIGELCCKDK